MSSQSEDRFARDLRGFGPLGVIAILIIVAAGNITTGIVLPLGGILTLLWVRWSHTPWRDIGYVRPKSWVMSIVGGIVLGVALKFVLKSIVMPLLGADPVNFAYHYLAGNSALLPAAVLMMLIAGFGEETVFRGFLFERLGKLLGNSNVAKASIVLITTVLFALAHFPDQGLPGVEQAVGTGLVFGTIFALNGSIFMLMCAHAAYDLTALAMIYLNLENAAAHLFFK